MAARGVGRIDGKDFTRPRRGIRAAHGWPSARDSVVMLPFSLLVALVYWQRAIQIGASFLVIGFGIFRLIKRRHPRALVRIRPTQLGLWSFAVAIAHGAGLMLVPIYLGLCRNRRSRQGSRGGQRPHQRRSWHGHPGLCRPFCRDDRSRRIVSVAGLPLPRVKAPIAEMVQFRCDLGHQPPLGRSSLAGVMLCGPALNRIAAPATESHGRIEGPSG